MSELKATTVYDAYWKANSVGEGTGILVYLKSEADKVIAEKDKAIAKLIDIDSKNRSAYYKDLVMMAKDVEHQKYKRCMAMAWWCSAELGMLVSTWEFKIKHYKKWHNRWLELAEQFKPNNSTAQ